MARTGGRDQRRSWFTSVSSRSAAVVGHPLSCIAASGVILVWALTGFLFRFSDTWQLIINTGTTVITFLMVFLIQHTQNRESLSMQIKLDEIIRSLSRADNSLIDLDRMSDAELQRVHRRFKRLAHAAEDRLRKGRAG
jgi:low affinity Fe/Cu permease